MLAVVLVSVPAFAAGSFCSANAIGKGTGLEPVRCAGVTEICWAHHRCRRFGRKEAEILFLIYAKDASKPHPVFPEAVELDAGLYLVETALTRSQLYHAVKRLVSPRRLLVAPLSDLPKFKGMRQGALSDMKKLRSNRNADLCRAGNER